MMVDRAHGSPSQYGDPDRPVVRRRLAGSAIPARDGFRDQGTRADPDPVLPWPPSRDRTAEPNNKDSR